ncbi:MAG: thiamine biosynthesis protein [Desulfobulbus propionicus]|nr:MAG: thiamine biosynthesis protein [Desulfobulbus propionicus]
MGAVAALGLYSGGLDSILACRVLAEQGITVRALKFTTPFFDHELLENPSRYQLQARERYGIEVELIDLSRQYIPMLRAPAHGFGKRFNPCIDCKILMLSTARGLMEKYGAAFLFTGEVVGQRPMSQRRDTLRAIERDSGCEGILLRPLSARFLPPTRPEQLGLVDRDRLYGFTGRGRKEQIALAASLGITEYPAPAGGCLLTDVTLGARIAGFHADNFLIEYNQLSIDDFTLMHVGRQFRLAGGAWLVLGRNARENKRLELLAGPGDALLHVTDRPGPLGILRRADLLGEELFRQQVLSEAASCVIRYAKKIDGLAAPGRIEIRLPEGGIRSIEAEPMEDAELQERQI